MRQWQFHHKRVEPELGFVFGLILGAGVMALTGHLWALWIIGGLTVLALGVAWRSRVQPVEKVDHCLNLVDWPRLMERLSEGDDPLWPWVSPEGSAGSDFNKAVNKIRKQREELLAEVSDLTAQVDSLSLDLEYSPAAERSPEESLPT